MLKIQQVFNRVFWPLINHSSSWILTVQKALPEDLPCEVSAFGFSRFLGLYIDIFQKKHLFLGHEKEEEKWP